jgi:hypothetical protein
MNYLPLQNNIRDISNFSENFFTSQGAPPVSTTPAANLRLVAMTPAENLSVNLPPVMLVLTQVAN